MRSTLLFESTDPTIRQSSRERLRRRGGPSAQRHPIWRRAERRSDPPISPATNVYGSRAATGCTTNGDFTRMAASRTSTGGSLSSSSGDVIHGWALEGRGLSLEAFWDVAEDLKAGRLVECLADYTADGIELFAAFAPSEPTPPRIRLFVDFITAARLS
jgi:DNA-binding transcriptional LysR family regulator